MLCDSQNHMVSNSLRKPQRGSQFIHKYMKEESQVSKGFTIYEDEIRCKFSKLKKINVHRIPFTWETENVLKKLTIA